VNLEQLLDLPATSLEAISDIELESICKPFWNVTRPEMVVKTDGVKKAPKIMNQQQMELETKKIAALKLAASLGIKIGGKM
jgi:hypothetical protein